MVHRIYVEKKPGFDVEAQSLAKELSEALQISALSNVRLFVRYDCEGIDEETFGTCIPVVFSEPQSDTVYFDLPEIANAHIFATEYLPGQFDQRADSAAECIQLVTQNERPLVQCAKVYVLEGTLSDPELTRIKSYLINPVEAREASLDTKSSLALTVEPAQKVPVLEGFLDHTRSDLARVRTELGLAMDLDDLAFFQEYFKEIDREPTLAELKVVDTYWSDHCRHTTFETELTDISFNDEVVQCAFNTYLNMREDLRRTHKPVTLMDMATTGARWLEQNGYLTTLDKSDEINACTVKETVMVDGKPEEWLFLFKNETHNHPTEIEPFGGAATCIGGAIRDPLSGRSYVYQAMRVTGAANPLTPVSNTLKGKLAQSKLTTTAAAGYSSYGNQIGLATGQVSELYHPGYVAKRMEIGAVLGATPKSHVRREVPQPGDVVILLGGKTGRDGIGGATGSSKAHNLQSLTSCGAEVQKGNAPVERKLQRLFRRADACKLIIRCNDFGAGGVSVAIGELADGLDINLDAVPKKYEGLDGLELAISESQERMAVVVHPQDVSEFMKYAAEENLGAVHVATVTDDAHLTMHWESETIVRISRAFLNTNGAQKQQVVTVDKQASYQPSWQKDTLENSFKSLVADLTICSQKGLIERFDSTIGAGTVLMPLGGKTQLTPAQSMVALLPVLTATSTCSGMAWGFNPYIMEQDQYRGAYLSVIESVSKLVATGFKRAKSYLTFQEYFERLATNPNTWGKPVSALLGALMAQKDLKVAAIGGKDSMSGSFEDLHVPPTLVSFACALEDATSVISPEFKQANNTIYWVKPHMFDSLLPDTESLLSVLNFVEENIASKNIVSAYTPGHGGLAESLLKMCVGNQLGASVCSLNKKDLFAPYYGSFVVEVPQNVELEGSNEFDVIKLGSTTSDYTLTVNDEVLDLHELQTLWEETLHDVFPYKAPGKTEDALTYLATSWPKPLITTPKPKVIIPVFPGTNCEFDTMRAFERAGANPETFVIRNLSSADCIASVEALAKKINNSQILMLPGGFSGGDEPDGSAKFITAFFRNPLLTEAVRNLLNKNDGLILGICNGFQALIKLGLVPFGDIVPMTEECPTLTFNTIGRHQSRLVHTRICSNKSPWLQKCTPGEIHAIAISHGEGRFVASPEMLNALKTQGQICTQYCNEQGVVSSDLDVNPNGSVWGIEGICSPDGRILGKMGHTERSGEHLYKNVPGNTFQPLIEGGVEYFA